MVGGVRDRKRAETLRRIHDAAAELTKRDGLAEATVSAIAERAGVSRRTFFNYFDSKEDAVLGIQQPQISPEALDAFVEDAVGQPTVSAGSERFRRALRMTVTGCAEGIAAMGAVGAPARCAVAAAGGGDTGCGAAETMGASGVVGDGSLVNTRCRFSQSSISRLSVS